MNLVETNLLAARIMAEQEVNVDEVIRELIDTSWGGSNDSQAKAMELLKGLAFSDDPKSNKFMAALDKFTSGLDPQQFTEGYQKEDFFLKETSEKKISKDNLIKLFPAGTSEFRMIMNMEKGDSGVHKAKKDGKNYEVFYRGGDNYLIRKV